MDERVFVFDLLAILPQYAQEFNDLLEPSWSSNHILKLGQGLNQDMRVRYYNRFPPLSSLFEFIFVHKHRNYLPPIR